jgi:putative Holliday junction resolvase
MRIMGLDFGRKRIGIAISDELGWTAQGLETLERQDIRKDLDYLAHLVKTYGVEELVVGLPRDQQGEIGLAANEVLAFIDLLKEKIDIPITTWDERFTTAAATRSLIEADLSRRKRKRVIDKVAAVLILQGYLDRRSKEKK